MVILDTSFIFAYYNEDDYFHADSVRLMQEIQEGKYGSLIIPDYVFDELITISLNKLKNLDKVIRIGDDVLSYVNLINIDEDLFNDSWEIFKNQEDTKFSFTDCSIIALMRNRNIKNLITFDEDSLKIDGINIIR